MIEWLNTILDLVSNYVDNHLDIYYILPFIFAAVVFYVQLKKGNQNFMSLVLFCTEIFSITTSFEYISLFIVTGTLPKSLIFLDKIILLYGTLIAFLLIFHHTTEGSWIGTQIDNILKKHVFNKPMLIPVSPFTEELEKLKSLREELNTGNKEQVNISYQVFLENGSFIMRSLTKNGHFDREDIKLIQILFDNCKKNFKNMCDKQIFMKEKIVETGGSLSEFIGSIDGFTKQL